MATASERPCANPACFCQTSDVTCSLWCGALDRPAGVRCVCRHEGCTRPGARVSAWSPGARRIVRDPLTTSQPGVLPGARGA
jgi:hypothetical protein